MYILSQNEIVKNTSEIIQYLVAAKMSSNFVFNTFPSLKGLNNNFKIYLYSPSVVHM